MGGRLLCHQLVHFLMSKHFSDSVGKCITRSNCLEEEKVYFLIILFNGVVHNVLQNICIDPIERLVKNCKQLSWCYWSETRKAHINEITEVFSLLIVS